MLGTALHEDLLPAEGYAKETLLQQATDTSKEILSLFPACKAVANTFRFDHGNGIRYYTAIYTEDKLTVSEEYVSEEILDKVGSGDCFMAGLIYGLYQKKEMKELKIEEGKVSFKMEFDGGMIDYKLTMEGEKLNGTVLSNYGEFPIVAVRSAAK